MANAESVDTLRYNEKGQLTDAITVRPFGSVWKRYVTQPHYNTLGQLTGTGIATPAGRDSLGFGYNAQTIQLQSFRDMAQGVTSIAYSGEGLPEQTTLPNGLVSTQGYSSTHMLESIRYPFNVGIDNAAGVRYRYDNIRVAERFRSSNRSGYFIGIPLAPVTSLLTFARTVGKKGPWDYNSNIGPMWEYAGNFNYGATGAALGIPDNILLHAAGLVQSLNPTGSQPENGHWYGLQPPMETNRRIRRRFARGSHITGRGVPNDPHPTIEALPDVPLARCGAVGMRERARNHPGGVVS